MLVFGVLLGFKHATEVDHVVAVSNIVSEQRSVWRSTLVGLLWGTGHTAALLAVGVVVLFLRIAVPEWIAAWLEFAVALMIIGLGLTALVRARRKFHLHRHTHDGVSHTHVHFHDQSEATAIHSHSASRVGLKPIVVGAVHGFAGSAVLTLLVLTQIRSPMLGLFYLALFGLGSIVGMQLLSALIGLPFMLASRYLSRWTNTIQTTAAVLSIAFGCWYAYETGIHLW